MYTFHLQHTVLSLVCQIECYVFNVLVRIVWFAWVGFLFSHLFYSLLLSPLADTLIQSDLQGISWIKGVIKGGSRWRVKVYYSWRLWKSGTDQDISVVSGGGDREHCNTFPIARRNYVWCSLLPKVKSRTKQMMWLPPPQLWVSQEGYVMNSRVSQQGTNTFIGFFFWFSILNAIIHMMTYRQRTKDMWGQCIFISLHTWFCWHCTGI